ncbi:DDE-type integrase/transposase/recombinase, partial [bacterium]|nr:DDE-type integrase/transposase/recombinase [bacterium]
REPGRNKPKPDKLNQWWGIDMTKFMIEGIGWIYLTVVLDWYSRKIVGYHTGIQSQSKHWLEALNMAVNNQCSLGSQLEKINLMSDNGSQPTSKSFIKECAVLGINQAFTSYNNPKGNANTERMMRTIKEELIWLSDWKTLKETQEAIAQWIDDDYNTSYVHSAIGYMSPAEFENNCIKIRP